MKKITLLTIFVLTTVPFTVREIVLLPDVESTNKCTIPEFETGYLMSEKMVMGNPEITGEMLSGFNRFFHRNFVNQLFWTGFSVAAAFPDKPARTTNRRQYPYAPDGVPG